MVRSNSLAKIANPFGNIPLERRIQTISTYITVLTPFALVALNIFCIINPLLWLPYLLYLTWIFYLDARVPVYKRAQRMSTRVRSMPHLLRFRDYFPSQLIKTADLHPKKPYMLCIHPHGIIGMSVWANFITHAPGSFNEVFPGVDLRVVTLESNFSIPFFRDYLYAMGCIGSDKKSILTTLQHKTSVLLVVGGAEESLHARPGNRDIVIKKRYGFVKLALIAGAALVPVFAFGENELYKQIDNPKGSRLRAFQEFCKRVLGFTLPMVNGRGIFMYNFGFMPHRRWLCTLVGAPIEIPKIDNPSPTEIEKYHKVYMEALRDLYENNKVKLGFGHKKIHFI